MAEKPPTQVYPDPDGTTNATYVPSNTTLAAGSLITGALSVGAAAAGTGAAVDAGQLFLQSAVSSGTLDSTVALVSAVPLPYITATILFGLLSLGLGTWNLVHGYRMKLRLLRLSERVYAQSEHLIAAYKKEMAAGKEETADQPA
ncbi:MAG TPA: hypothetical protein VE685_20045 [Thermoanaerobaculia bacterium]|nr:hypothetical protein [Thermoanaerobaculia bacterium]